MRRIAHHRGYGQRSKVPINHRRNPSEHLEQRLHPFAQARRGILSQVDRAHQAERDRHRHGDQRADHHGAPEQRDRAVIGSVAWSGDRHRIGRPMRAKQEVSRADDLEEPHGFKQQRGDNSEGGENRHHRGEQQAHPHRAFNPGAGGKLRGQPPIAEGCASKAEQQRDGYPAITEQPDRAAERFDQRKRIVVESGAAVPAGECPAFRQNCIALDPEGGEIGRRRAGRNLRQDQARADCRPDQCEQQRRNQRPQCYVPGMVNRQRMDLLGAGALECPGPRTRRQPANQAESEDQQKWNGWRHVRLV